MGLTQEVGKIWNSRVPRREVTDTTWIQEILKTETGIIHPKNRIAAVLHRFIKAGCAKKGKTRNSYKKLKNFKPRRVIPKLNEKGLLDVPVENESIEPIAEPSVGILALGHSILAIIDDFKEKIIELRKQLSEERKTVGELVEEKRHLEELYKKAQTRILELNTGDKGRTFNMGELQSFRDELPEKGK